jgi:hypothetical protein
MANPRRVVALLEMADEDPAATSHRYPTAEGRIMPPPGRELVEREIATVAAFNQEVRKAVGGRSG